MIIEETDTVPEICERLKHMGYGIGKDIRMYGERFEVLSDPFPDHDGIAVLVKTHGTDETRIVLLPATVIQTASRSRQHSH